jgi:hypothetical protein
MSARSRVCAMPFGIRDQRLRHDAVIPAREPPRLDTHITC